MNGIHDMGGMDGFGPSIPSMLALSSTRNGKARSWPTAAGWAPLGLDITKAATESRCCRRISISRPITAAGWNGSNGPSSLTVTPMLTKSPQAMRFAQARPRQGASSPWPISTGSAAWHLHSPGNHARPVRRGRPGSRGTCIPRPIPGCPAMSRPCRSGGAVAWLPRLPGYRGDGPG